MTSQEAVRGALRAQTVEVPSWAYGNSGTRFKVFAQRGRAARPVREDRRRGAGAPVHRGRAEGLAAHPVGQGRRLRRARRARRGAGRARSAPINSNVFQDDDYKLGCVTNPDPRVRAQGDRPPARVHRHHGRDRVARPEDLVLPTAPTTRARTTCAPGRTGWPTALREIYDRLGDGPAAAAGVQALRAGLLHDRRARTGAPRTLHCLALGRAGAGRARHRPPRAGHEHRVHRRVPAAGRASSARSTSTPASTPTTT